MQGYQEKILEGRTLNQKANMLIHQINDKSITARDNGNPELYVELFQLAMEYQVKYMQVADKLRQGIEIAMLSKQTRRLTIAIKNMDKLYQDYKSRARL